MVSLERIVWMAVCVVFLASNATMARAQADLLRPGQPGLLFIVAGRTKIVSAVDGAGRFCGDRLESCRGGLLAFLITGPARNELASSNSDFNDSAMFVAPRDGEYTFRIQLDKDSEAKGPQNILVQYKHIQVAPGEQTGRDPQDQRLQRANYAYASPKDETGYSIVLIERNGRLKNILKAEAQGEAMRFTFGDRAEWYDNASERRGKALIKSTGDITGDGVPDVMIDYYSGGAHCCFESYFINLGKTPETSST